MDNNTKQRLVDLRGVLLKLLETSEDEGETNFLYYLLDKTNKRLGE